MELGEGLEGLKDLSEDLEGHSLVADSLHTRTLDVCLFRQTFHSLTGLTTPLPPPPACILTFLRLLLKPFLPNSRFQILPLIENLEWLYIWGVVRSSLFVCTPSSVGPSVGRSVGRGI